MGRDVRLCSKWRSCDAEADLSDESDAEGFQGAENVQRDIILTDRSSGSRSVALIAAVS